MRRVVVTGLGLVSPLAGNIEYSWKRLLEGRSGVRRITEFDVSDLPCQIAARIPLGDGTEGPIMLIYIWNLKSNEKLMHLLFMQWLLLTKHLQMLNGFLRVMKIRFVQEY